VSERVGKSKASLIHPHSAISSKQPPRQRILTPSGIRVRNGNRHLAKLPICSCRGRERERESGAKLARGVVQFCRIAAVSYSMRAPTNGHVSIAFLLNYRTTRDAGTNFMQIACGCWGILLFSSANTTTTTPPLRPNPNNKNTQYPPATFSGVDVCRPPSFQLQFVGRPHFNKPFYVPAPRAVDHYKMMFTILSTLRLLQPLILIITLCI
jgi:hypothetical protein